VLRSAQCSAACTLFHAMPHIPVECRYGACCTLYVAPCMCCMVFHTAQGLCKHTYCRCSRACLHVTPVCCACAVSRHRRFHSRWHTGARRKHDCQHREHCGAHLARLWARRVPVEVATGTRVVAEKRVRIGAGRQRRVEIRAALAIARGIVLCKRSRSCSAGRGDGAHRRHPQAFKFSSRCQGVQ
jgi:hypothetical protein